MRKGCRGSKFEKGCQYYSYNLLKCKLGLVATTCKLVKQLKLGTKDKKTQTVRDVYNKDFLQKEKNTKLKLRTTSLFKKGYFVTLTMTSDYGKMGTNGIIEGISSTKITIQFFGKTTASTLPYPTHLISRISKLN